MGVGFQPPDAPEWGEDDPPSSPIGTGTASVESTVKDDDEPSTWQYQEGNILLAVVLGPFSIVIGKHE